MQHWIRDYIIKNGPIPFSKFIEIAMYSKDIGYYMCKNPIGKDFDYITSPEISSIFGEIIAIWLVSRWQSMGLPKDIVLVELGPGTGIMMLDILNALRQFEDFYSSLSVSMIEISPKLRDIQMATLRSHLEKISWLESFEELSQKKMLLVANEFFDALPVDQFIFLGGKWLENKVTKDFQIKPFATDFEFVNQVGEGGIIERCFAGKKISDQIIGHLENHGGSAVIIDYGYMKNRYVGTIQCVKNHRHCDIFSNIGDADITHEVDFSYLFPNETILTQREFLLKNGIAARYEMLSKNMDESRKKILSRSIERLTSPDYMGTMFKCVEICYNQ